MAAPTKPPIRACEELEGMPSHQVSTFQTMAEISAARATGTVTASPVTTSLQIVLATATPNKKGPAKLARADMPNAQRGDIAREAIAVATTLALSWNPFRKSKVSAMMTNKTRTKFKSKPPEALACSRGWAPPAACTRLGLSAVGREFLPCRLCPG